MSAEKMSPEKMSIGERLKRVNERDAPEESVPLRVAVLVAVVAAASATLSPVSYTHLTLPTNREV